MAGKTFRGVGDDEDPSLSRDAAPLIADEDDAQGLHSGPTVVDDKKVEEVLRKLRSLDKPPGPLTGVTQAVTDGASTERVPIHPGGVPLDSGPEIDLGSGPTAIATAADDLLYAPQNRATAIGRSPATPNEAAPVTVPADLARGTLFGRSIHLPDVNSPDDDVDVEVASAPHFLDGTPPPLAPFPLAEPPVIPPLAPPVAKPIERFHLPFDVDSQTQLVDPPPSRKLKNTIAFLAGIAIVGGGLWAWSRYGGHREDPSPPTAAAPAAPAAPPAVAPIQPPAEPAPAAAQSGEVPAPAAKAAAAEAKPEAAAPKPAEEPAPAPAPRAAAVKQAGGHSHRSAGSSTRHAAARAPAPPPADESGGEAKPARPHKKGAAAEDPDATMAPSD
ncbi:MAG TPA: hypothetical protein VKQ32_17700 [Polyangia bacterium]|nr:hypothetical protein [Polyangia bacterium]